MADWSGYFEGARGNCDIGLGNEMLFDSCRVNMWYVSYVSYVSPQNRKHVKLIAISK